ncbi:AAA family ATPase [Rhizobium sp. AB2/73]|nr:AAA family ATPase [Rhizobium sp. AB2/73]UEQ83004.1 AAA family ATPase [Rhizobium sp. AB2/73]
MAQIIVLHGASSSGKTTVAKTLQNRIEKPFLHLSIDHYRDAGILPMNRFLSGEFAWKDARQTIFNGFHASLAAFADAGNNIILEHILDSDGWLEMLSDLLSAHDVFFVAIHCPLDILIEREKQRGDRPLGSAQRDFETIHIGKRYDLEIDGSDGVDANVDQLLTVWRNGMRSSSFRSLPLAVDCV